MDKEKRKQLIQNYQEREREMGVYSITNTVNGRRLVAASANLDGAWNRDRFGLETGLHPNKELQEDWKKYGPDVFTFEVLEKFKTDSKLTFDYKDVLGPEVGDQGAGIIRGYRKEAFKQEKLWIEKMNSYTPLGYNER